MTGHDLHHHGDRDLGDGLVDLAVNVRVSAPPPWLAAVITDTVGRLAGYPRTDEAVAAIAAAHRLSPAQVLPTAGGAEAFTLLARALDPEHPVIVHPQFTEPEAALIAAGHQPDRVILTPETGFDLDPADIPADADLIMIGNPTNPTSVLHPARLIHELIRPGRLVVVDEAFMDAVPGQVESMIGGVMPGLIVLRSLTKTWGLAGLRAGYAVGDEWVITGMRGHQPPWSVSTPALAAMVACLSPDALQIAERAAAEIGRHRAYLLDRLAAIGLPVVGSPQAPFVLVDTTPVRGTRPTGWVRLALREHGFAVRRGETFPGLGPDWVRIAVREEEITDRFSSAVRRVVRL
jgi:cobyrinic acid a,c-diamide synthase